MTTQPKRSRRVMAVVFRWAVATALVVILLRLTGCMERLFYVPTAGPTPPPIDVPGVEEVRFESADGTACFGWFIPAQGRGSGTGPAASILHVHGNAGNIVGHQWFSEALPPAGFNVLIFDYRGYGQSEGRARRRDDLIQDTDAALDALLARPDVDPGRIGLYGQSLGGAVAVNVMADRPEIRAAVLESPFASWREIAANAVGGEPPNPVARLLARLLIPDGRRPLDAIARIDRPVLILHGSRDTIIPVSHGRRLAEAGPTASLTILDGGEHNSLRTTHPEVDRIMIEFFREATKGSIDR